MSDRSSPMNGDYEASNSEPAMRLTVRKDLFPNDRSPKVSAIPDELGDVSCVKLETDFEQSIDDIANQKLQVANGLVPSPEKSRHRKHKQRSRHSSERISTLNGCLPKHSKKKKSSLRESHSHRTQISSNSSISSRVKGGKNLNLVSSSECQAEEESSEDELLTPSVKLPVSVVRQSGKPYSHKLSQLSSKKNKSKSHSKERRSHVVVPSSGKPRSMLNICSSQSKKKSKKSSECTATYKSQIVNTTSIKIKIRRTSSYEMVTPPTIPEIAPKKSKKKKASTPVVSESSGEEYDPSRGDTAASMSVAAPKPRNPPPKTRKSNNAKHRDKSQKTEASKASGSNHRGDPTVPQSPWAVSVPEHVLEKIFEYVVSSQGTLPSVIRMGRVCKLWHSISCRPNLWRSVDLAQHTHEKHKIDYRLVWLLENRLSQCHTLNLAHWKVSNMPWVVSTLRECAPALTELGLAGWSRLTADLLYDLLHALPALRRIDLSLTSETGGSGTCLSAANMARIVESVGDRITHLTMANNKFTALQQILTSIATHCPNLEVLDISGARATSHPAAVPLEALQKGCPKMRVFRAANAQLVLAPVPLQQMSAAGWAGLEELSVAGEAAAERVGVGEYRLGDEALERLVRGATSLRLLDLRGLQRLSDSGLVRVPAWDLQHLFLGGCNVSRQNNSGLELICEKWSHSLLELDLSWATATRALNAAVEALADARQSRLKMLNLCGSSVSLEPVKKVLLKCPNIEYLNLSSCRALPRGMKRTYTGKELLDLKESLDPQKAKTKEENKQTDKEQAEDISMSEADSKSESLLEKSDQSEVKVSQDKLCSSSESDAAVKSSDSSNNSLQQMTSETSTNNSPDSKMDSKEIDRVTKILTDTSKILSPSMHSKPDSSSTPRSEASKVSSPHFSPLSKPDSQAQDSPEIHQDLFRGSSSWSLGQYKTTPSHRSEASPLSSAKIKQCKMIEQCSPTTSQESKLSPESVQHVKQDTKNINNWNYGQVSQRSPYSAQPSPAQPSPAQPSPYSAQPSPYSTQPSPYSAQPSPYSSQPSPYSAQPSPDTSQMGKSELQKTGSQWNAGNYSPLTKHPAPFSPLPAAHPSPDPGQYNAGWGDGAPLWAPPPPLWSIPLPAGHWNTNQFRMMPPHAQNDNFVEQHVPFEPPPVPRSPRPPHQRPPHQHLPAYLDEGYGRASHLD